MKFAPSTAMAKSVCVLSPQGPPRELRRLHAVDSRRRESPWRRPVLNLEGDLHVSGQLLSLPVLTQSSLSFVLIPEPDFVFAPIVQIWFRLDEVVGRFRVGIGRRLVDVARRVLAAVH